MDRLVPKSEEVVRGNQITGLIVRVAAELAAEGNKEAEKTLDLITKSIESTAAEGLCGEEEIVSSISV
jgi:hypothetical protein